MSRSSGFGLEVSKGVVAQVLMLLIGFAGSIVFARVLGPVKYGAFHVLVAVVNVLDNPIRGLGTACKKRIAEHNRDDGSILTIGLTVTTLLGGAIAIVTVILGPRVGYFDIPNGSQLAAILFLSMIYFKILQQMVSGKGQFGTAVGVDLSRSLFTIPLQLALVLMGFGVTGMVYGLAAASLLTVPISLYILDTRPAIPSRETVRSVLSYARYSMPSSFVGTAYGRLDVILLGAVLGSGASGQYKIAMQLALPATLLSMVMGSGLLAEVSSLRSQSKAVATQVTNNVTFASLLAIPLFFGALAMAESVVVTIFGPDYRPASGLLIGLAVYQIFRTQATLISSVLEGIERPDIVLKLQVVTLSVNLILGVALVYKIGTIGVVYATIIAEGTKLALLTMYARREVPYNPFPKPIQYQFVAGAIMFTVVELLHRWWGVSSWIDMISLVGVGALVYGALLITLSDIFKQTAASILADARRQYLR